MSKTKKRPPRRLPPIRAKGTRMITRGQKKNALKSYARRRALSHCRGKRLRTCNKTKGCKAAIGKKRSFCRKSKSVRRT